MIFKKYIVIAVITLCTLNFSCTKDFEEVNTDPNRISQISPGSLLNPIVYEVSSFNTLRADAFTFDIMQVALPYPSVAGGVHRYDISESAGNSTWSTYYRWLSNVKEMLATSEKAQDVNYQAIALTLNAWIYSNLTDCFGDIPMVEASSGEEGILKPKFNTQQEVYTKIIADLEKANTLYDATKPMIYATDILYGNSVAGWKRFTNSLRLRLLLRVSKRTEMDAFTKMATILNNPTVNPVFTNINEGAVVKLSGVTPLISPWGRAIDFTTFRATGGFFLDNLNAFADPRRAKFNSFSRTLAGASTGTYQGIPSGYSPNDPAPNFQPSNFNVALVTAPMSNIIMTYAEVEFIRAELAQKGLITADAKTAYERGVKAAIEQWGVTMPTNYFTNTATAYNGTLERIMLQKYYALFFTDYQQWFEYRRTGFPVLPKNAGMLNDQKLPVRFRFPTTVSSNNRDNYLKAVENMGGDNINTKLWWEK
ncbi:SusD/RagB family nutrient-binding outer membrane lipoprotein [Pedobacter cryophilus]|uniref:SusD/RagB family nutrient-binding outer membrane lipoprotein n=1 Tax=Pedobacter cryophilus TaxID=2571271 RepID=A0A4U1C4A8_9SPHI|nr:SusD/RagB family nutrient-binding outer membrane lipoprotein [Pedobacter cryophilus]TKC00716.1 SusD/RagB family nutrient-binding outer membrane lipoprotein [Pedobacter cryophilus]